MSKKNAGRRKRRTFTVEFKAEAVEHYRAGSRSISEIAKDLDLTDSSLRNWIEKAAPEAANPSATLASEEREELKSLRKRVRELEMDREILKKAAVDSTHRCGEGFISRHQALSEFVSFSFWILSLARKKGIS